MLAMHEDPTMANISVSAGGRVSDAEKYRAYANDLLRNPDDPDKSIVNQFSVLSEKKEYAKHYLPLAKRAYDLAPGEICHDVQLMHPRSIATGILKRLCGSTRLALTRPMRNGCRLFCTISESPTAR